MPKYIVGQTYKAYWNSEIHTFKVLEVDENGVYGIRWDDGFEEWSSELDMDRWIQAVKEKEEEEV